MVDQRYIDFIEKIISKTKEKNLNWRYLDSNKELYENMGWTNSRSEYDILMREKIFLIPKFNTDDSFYTNINNMYVVIYVWENQPAKLYIVPPTYKKVTTLPPDEYGEYITRLLNLVQSQFPNAEAFIDNFLNEENETNSN